MFLLSEIQRSLIGEMKIQEYTLATSLNPDYWSFRLQIQ